MYNSRGGGLGIPRGFEVLPYFIVKCSTQGTGAGVKYPFHGGKQPKNNSRSPAFGNFADPFTTTALFFSVP